MHLKIPTPHEFNFQECLIFLNRSVRENLHQIKSERLIKLFNHQEELLLFEITHSNRHLNIEFLQAVPSEQGKEAVISYVTEWFDLQRNLSPFYGMAANDPILRRLTQEHYGLRVLGIPDLFEALSWAIMGQQINLTFAYLLKERVVENFGRSATYEGQIYWTFPACETIAALPVSELRKLQFTTRKAEYIIGVANEMASGKLTKKNFANEKDTQKIEKTLTAIRGIGPWSANYVMMKCLAIPSAFPKADVGLHNALKKELGLDRKPSLTEIERWAKNWKGWEAYATFYLWRSLYE